MKDDVWVWTMERSCQKERKPEGQNLPGALRLGLNGAWPAGGMLPNAEEPGHYQGTVGKAPMGRCLACRWREYEGYAL